MATKLEKPLRRELPVNGEPYTLTISPEGLKLVPKGKRKGHELTWKDLLNGQPAVASAPTSPLDSPSARAASRSATRWRNPPSSAR